MVSVRHPPVRGATPPGVARCPYSADAAPLAAHAPVHGSLSGRAGGHRDCLIRVGAARQSASRSSASASRPSASASGGDQAVPHRARLEAQPDARARPGAEVDALEYRVDPLDRRLDAVDPGPPALVPAVRDDQQARPRRRRPQVDRERVGRDDLDRRALAALGPDQRLEPGRRPAVHGRDPAGVERAVVERGVEALVVELAQAVDDVGALERGRVLVERRLVRLGDLAPADQRDRVGVEARLPLGVEPQREGALRARPRARRGRSSTGARPSRGSG